MSEKNQGFNKQKAGEQKAAEEKETVIAEQTPVEPTPVEPTEPVEPVVVEGKRAVNKTGKLYLVTFAIQDGKNFYPKDSLLEEAQMKQEFIDLGLVRLLK